MVSGTGAGEGEATAVPLVSACVSAWGGSAVGAGAASSASTGEAAVTRIANSACLRASAGVRTVLAPDTRQQSVSTEARRGWARGGLRAGGLAGTRHVKSLASRRALFQRLRQISVNAATSAYSVFTGSSRPGLTQGLSGHPAQGVAPPYRTIGRHSDEPGGDEGGSKSSHVLRASAPDRYSGGL
jgi:hypothetical protein